MMLRAPLRRFNLLSLTVHVDYIKSKWKCMEGRGNRQLKCTIELKQSKSYQEQLQKAYKTHRLNILYMKLSEAIWKQFRLFFQGDKQMTKHKHLGRELEIKEGRREK